MFQDVLSDAEKVAARKLHENEERLGLLTDKWKDRWKEMQKIMQVSEYNFFVINLVLVLFFSFIWCTLKCLFFIIQLHFLSKSRFKIPVLA